MWFDARAKLAEIESRPQAHTGDAAMSYGEVAKTDWQNLVTIRPGPVLHVWRSGSEFCVVPLTHRAALNLIGSLTAAMQVSDAPEVREAQP
jgi:hypothetical protein